ncbi:MAG: TraR/DksA C4-type zinc finger protein [Deltaproteobacteria bacterium]|nr:TraR/DksA C4-type zinc finger protein [Deltaproteobacteria bacterium]
MAKTESTKLSKTDQKRFLEQLEAERQRIIQLAAEATDEEKNSTTDDLQDEVDVATNEVSKAIIHKLRDRERTLLSKIDLAIERMNKGTYNTCESCGGPIGLKRLEARPVTTLCITCKEEQERGERDMAG